MIPLTSAQRTRGSTNMLDHADAQTLLAARVSPAAAEAFAPGRSASDVDRLDPRSPPGSARIQ
jgi:hypothetical protein